MLNNSIVQNTAGKPRYTSTTTEGADLKVEVLPRFEEWETRETSYNEAYRLYMNNQK